MNIFHTHFNLHLLIHLLAVFAQQNPVTLGYSSFNGYIYTIQFSADPSLYLSFFDFDGNEGNKFSLFPFNHKSQS